MKAHGAGMTEMPPFSQLGDRQIAIGTPTAGIRTGSLAERVLFWVLVLSFAVPLQMRLPLGEFLLPIYFFDVPLLALAVVWLLQIVMRDVPPRWQGLDAVLMVFFLWLMVTSLAGFDPHTSIAGALLWLRVLLVFFYFRNRVGRAIAQASFLRIMSILLAVEVVVAVAQIATQSTIGALNQYFGIAWVRDSRQWIAGTTWVTRVQGTFGNAKLFSTWLVMVLPFQLARALTVRRRALRIGHIALLGSGLLVLVLSLSRADIGAAVVAGTVFLVLVAPRERRRTVALVCIGAAIGAAALLWTGVPIGEALAKRVSSSSLLDPKRVAYIQSALAIAARHPMLGVGYDNFTLGMDLASFPFPVMPGVGVHCIPLLLLAEAGLPAALLLVGWIGGVMARIQRGACRLPRGRRTVIVAALASVTAASLSALFDVSFLHQNALITFSAVAGAGLAMRDRAAGAAVSPPAIGERRSPRSDRRWC